MKQLLFKLYLLLIYLLLYNAVYSQCNSCRKVKTDSISHCYTQTDFPNQCAQFIDKASYFYYNHKGKNYQFPYQYPIDSSYFLSLVRQRKIAKKFRAKDIVFLKKAIQSWESFLYKYGYDSLQSGIGLKYLTEIDSLKMPNENSWITFNYRGILENGAIFDSSERHKRSFKAKLGSGTLIDGLEEGLALLSEGSKAWIKIPSSLGYKKQFIEGIPPNSTLYYWVQILKVE